MIFMSIIKLILGIRGNMYVNIFVKTIVKKVWIYLNRDISISILSDLSKAGNFNLHSSLLQEKLVACYTYKPNFEFY